MYNQSLMLYYMVFKIIKTFKNDIYTQLEFDLC
jgi:hypothetical protein